LTPGLRLHSLPPDRISDATCVDKSQVSIKTVSFGEGASEVRPLCSL